MPFTPTRFRARSQSDGTPQPQPPHAPRARSSPVPTPPNPRALERQLRREAWLARLFSLTHPFRSRSTDFPVDDPEIITRARTEQRRKASEGKNKAARGVLADQQAKLKADLATARERLERSKSTLHALRKRKAELERWLVDNNNNHASHTQRFKAAQARLLVVRQRVRQAEETQLDLERREFTLARLVEEARRSSSGSPKHTKSAKTRRRAVRDGDQQHPSPVAPVALPANLVEVPRRWSMTNAMPRRAQSDNKPPRRASTSFLFGSKASLDSGAAVLSVYDDGPKRYTL